MTDSDQLAAAQAIAEEWSLGCNSISDLADRIARHAAQARLDAIEDAAALAKQWRDENRANMAEASGKPRDMLEGAAVECNALMRAIRALTSTGGDQK